MFEKVEEAAQQYQDYIAYDFMGTTITYKEFVEEVHTCARHYGDEYNTMLGANISGFKKVANAMISQGY